MVSQAQGVQLPLATGNCEEENGKDGVLLKAQRPCLQVTWRRAMGITCFLSSSATTQDP